MMNNEVHSLIRRLEELYNGKNWVAVGAEPVLDDIEPGSALEHKVSGRHSALEVLQHINAWRTFLLRKLQGETDFDLTPETDWISNKKLSPELWQDTVLEFKSLHIRIIEELQQLDDSALDQMVGKRRYDLRRLINGIIQHDYYHFGQIVLLS
jgi:uncharacterized damage-inducible protein DinB